MTGIDLIIVLAAVVITGLSIAYNYIKRKKAKACGTVSCSGCGMAGSCSASKKS